MQDHMPDGANKKVEKGQATRGQIIEAATRLFAEKGFEGTSIEAVLAETRVSRGALYHHFPSKEALFEAVVVALENATTNKLMAQAGKKADPVEALIAGCDAWLEMTSDPVVRRITLIDAPSVLGWKRWREIDAEHGLGLLKASLGMIAKTGRLPQEMVDPFAHMLLAALSEIALLVARSEDDRPARAALRELLNRLLLTKGTDS
jgi:AcrR family transcriptional regulator